MISSSEKYEFSSLLTRPHILQQESDLIRGVASLEGANLVVIDDLSAFEIWPDKRDGLLWEWIYKRGTGAPIRRHH
jgi:hypothetical protein